MDRRTVLLGGIGLSFSDTAVMRQSSSVKSLASYPKLRSYVEALRLIPAGTFQMGRDKYDNEKPVHPVTLSAFRMGATPVTVAVWREYCTATGTALPPSLTDLDDEPVALNDYDPVVNVSWEDIMGVNGNGGFCAWASGIAGLKLTLPSEAQWEYAALGGIDGQEYPWGDTFDAEKVWYGTGKDVRELLEKLPAPVNRKFNIYRNTFGLTDMAGNVLQWCSDWYGPYRAELETNPVGPAKSSKNFRVIRGSSYLTDDKRFLACAFRNAANPAVRERSLGFRLSSSKNT